MFSVLVYKLVITMAKAEDFYCKVFGCSDTCSFNFGNIHDFFDLTFLTGG